MITSVAIVHDHLTTTSPLSGLLDPEGEFEIQAVFDNLEEASERLQRFPVDIAIIDLCMQIFRGLEFIALMTGLRKQIKCLVYTVFDDENTVFAALRAGASAYILKDAEPAILRQALHELSRGGSPLSARIAGKLLNYFRQSMPGEPQNYFLSPREKETLRLVSHGLLTKEIAHRLGIQRETVKKHLANIYNKLNVQNKIEALNKFYGPQSTSPGQKQMMEQGQGLTQVGLE
ncbi:MAG TPA: response regulator transcription factor [Puia sp.]|nr:response regulator transcription factor [Puia sp.]